MNLTGLTDGQVRTLSQVEIGISGPEMDMGQFLRPNPTGPRNYYLLLRRSSTHIRCDTIRYDILF